MTRESVNVMGMPLERWTHESCVADFGVGDDWATLYTIQSGERNKGHATALLTEAKKHYENFGKVFSGSVALNLAMRRIYKKLRIYEWRDDE